MNQRFVIGLVGGKESGKTTTLTCIKQQNENIEELMLAGHLKRSLAAVYHAPLKLFEDQAFKEKEVLPHFHLSESVLEEMYSRFEIPKELRETQKHAGLEFSTPRKLMQYVGTEVLRALDPDIHIRWALKTATPGKILVVSDIRFFNEFEFFKKNAAFLSVGLSRPSLIAKDVHPSEVSVPAMIELCDVRLVNDGTKEDLQAKVAELVLPRIPRG